MSFTLIQERPPQAWPTSLLALHGAVLLTAGPVGAALGGPLTAAATPRSVLVGSGIVTIVLAAAAMLLWYRTTAAPGPRGCPNRP